MISRIAEDLLESGTQSKHSSASSEESWSTDAPKDVTQVWDFWNAHVFFREAAHKRSNLPYSCVTSGLKVTGSTFTCQRYLGKDPNADYIYEGKYRMYSLWSLILAFEGIGTWARNPRLSDGRWQGKLPGSLACRIGLNTAFCVGCFLPNSKYSKVVHLLVPKLLKKITPIWRRFEEAFLGDLVGSKYHSCNNVQGARDLIWTLKLMLCHRKVHTKNCKWLMMVRNLRSRSCSK